MKTVNRRLLYRFTMVGWFSRMVVAMTIRMPRWFVGWVSRRYVAGPTLDDAVKVMKRLSKEGACFTIDVLGEEITTMDEAQFFLEEYKRVVSAIIENQLDSIYPLNLQHLVLLLDQEKGMKNIENIVKMAHGHDMFVRLDMEDHRVTDDTIQVMLDMHAKGLTNVGVVLQGRLFRTLEDIKNIEEKIGPNADYRICKGIYLEPEDIAHSARQPIIDATNHCIDAMLDSGAYVGIASHDHPVINHTLKALESRGMGPGKEDPRTNAGHNESKKARL